MDLQQTSEQRVEAAFANDRQGVSPEIFGERSADIERGHLVRTGSTPDLVLADATSSIARVILPGTRQHRTCRIQDRH